MKKLVIVILTVLIAAAAAVIISVKSCLDDMPVLSQKPHTIYANVGETLSVNQLADVENAKRVFISGVESETDMSAAISDDKQSIMVGYNTGNLRVTVTAAGSNNIRNNIVVDIVVHVS